MNQQSSPSASPGIAGTIDPRAGLARAGFVCGLIGVLVTMFAALNFLIALFFYPLSQQVPLLTSGEVVLLLIAMVPVAPTGLLLSIGGWRSTTRHRRAVTGVALSAFTLVPFLVAIVVIYVSWTACQPDCL